MIWIALGLCAFTAATVGIITLGGLWERNRQGPFFAFAFWWAFGVVAGFLLPLWSLSFAVQPLGGEREGQTLHRLLTRPLPRWAIYLAKFLALLPWALTMNLGGFGVICLAAGRPGWQSFEAFWPAVVLATLAYCALFHLLAASFRWAAVIGLVYSFFVETFASMMPGPMKRISLAFYVRCLMDEKSRGYGLPLIRDPFTYMPVEGATAAVMLILITLLLLAVGMVVFSRLEYKDWSGA